MDKGKKEKKGLGRGLDALLGNSFDVGNVVVNPDSPSRIKTGSISKIPLESIDTNPWQPRNAFEEEALQQLSESIREHGLIQPVTVRQLENGRYQLISGERRVRASKLAGLTQITAYVRTADDMQMLEMALIENIQRQDLNPMEIALSLQRLQDECQITQEDLAVRVSKSRSAVTNYLRLLKLSEPVQQALCMQQISMGHARALVVAEPEQQQHLLKEIMEKDLSVRQTEDLLRQWQQKAAETAPKAKVRLPQAYQDAKKQLAGKFQTVVKIQRDAQGKGHLTFSFKSDEELDRLLSLLQKSGN
ncbi:MAG: ParB/RepB/Spo0J family partition protein [Bacteroidales bacterium]|nr:ParB/RepB/Spo0J family partition protein [Bacteroidales bacterium]